MNTEIAKSQKVIVMKSGLPLFVDAERAKNAEQILASGTGHRFLGIDEQTINSAEIEGIYSPEQYEEIQRIKKGDYKCKFQRWHAKREECSCGKEASERLQRYQRMKKRVEANDFTDEFQADAIKKYVEDDEAWLRERHLV